MTLRKGHRASDTGASQCARRAKAKKPQAFITRDSNGEYDIRAEDGVYLACAGKSREANNWCIAMGYSPVRNPYGDAPKTI